MCMIIVSPVGAKCILCAAVFFVCRKSLHPGVCRARRQVVVVAEYIQMPIFEVMFDKL